MNRCLNVILSFLMCLIVLGCGKAPKNWCQTHYDFQVNLTVSPDTYSYELGDTIRLSMFTDNYALIDSLGNREVEYPNFDPRLNFFLALFEEDRTTDGINTLEYFSDSITEVSVDYVSGLNRNSLKLVTIDTSESHSQFTLSLIPNIAGRYALYCHPSLRQISSTQTFPDRCDRQQLRGNELDVTVYYNESRELNKQILNQRDLDLEDIYWGDYDVSRSLSSAFYFEVE